MPRQLAQTGFIAPITTFAPEPYDVLQTIQAVVRPSDDEFIATFFDANISGQGGTETEAVENLKDLLLALFEHLSSMPAEKLGPGPSRQLAVLKAFIRKR